MKERTKAVYELLDIARLLRELKDENLKKNYPSLYATGCKQFHDRLDKLEEILKELEDGE